MHFLSEVTENIQATCIVFRFVSSSGHKAKTEHALKLMQNILYRTDQLS